MRTELDTAEPAKAWAFLEALYGVEMSITSDLGPVRCVTVELGRLRLSDLDIGVTVRCEVEEASWFAISELVHGQVESQWSGESRRAGAGDVFPITAPGQPCRAASGPRRDRIVGLDPEVLRRAARDRGDGERDAIRLIDPAPMRPEAAAVWHALLDHLWQTTDHHPQLLSNPLAAAAAAQLAAHTALTLVRNETWAGATESELGRDSNDGDQTAVRRAIAFMEGAAGSDLSLTDIAAAAHVTPRALQYGFRRQLSTTPMGYLRRVRLQHVRAELETAGPGSTVAEVASRWGFFNLGRFAAYYRAEFGENPAQTLAG